MSSEGTSSRQTEAALSGTAYRHDNVGGNLSSLNSRSAPLVSSLTGIPWTPDGAVKRTVNGIAPSLSVAFSMIEASNCVLGAGPVTAATCPAISTAGVLMLSEARRCRVTVSPDATRCPAKHRHVNVAHIDRMLLFCWHAETQEGDSCPHVGNGIASA